MSQGRWQNIYLTYAQENPPHSPRRVDGTRLFNVREDRILVVRTHCDPSRGSSLASDVCVISNSDRRIEHPCQSGIIVAEVVNEEQFADCRDVPLAVEGELIACEGVGLQAFEREHLPGVGVLLFESLGGGEVQQQAEVLPLL